MDALARLQGIYFFEHLTPEQLAAVASICQHCRFVQGDEILKQGHVTDHFFITDEGFVNLYHTDRSGFEKAVGSKGPGEFFGIKMFTTQEPSEYTFEAVNAATLWVMDRKDWDILLATNTDLLQNLPELRAEFARLTRGVDWLGPGEVIDILTRRHWWALFLMIRLPVFFMLLFTGAYLLSTRFGVLAQLPWVLYVYLLSLFFGLLWLGWNALNWWNDTYIVTNKRAVRINKVVFFSDSRQEVGVEKIQAQKVERGGPISVFLNISDLYLTSAASEEGGLVFEQVGNVDRIQKAIEGEKLKVTERRSAAQREKVRTQIANEMRHYVFQQHAPPEAPKPVRVRRSFVSRLRAVWDWMFGTEIRSDNVVTWRKHHIVLLQQVGISLAFFVALALLMIGVTIYGSAFELVRNGVYLGLGVLMLIAFGAIVWQWLDWQVDLYRLTETQIIDIESLPFGLRYSENKADLSKIQDVNNQRAGFMNTLLDYGDVIARVAGNADPFTFISVTHPRVVADEISERIVMMKLRETDHATREQTRHIVDAIVAYHRLVAAERNQDVLSPPAIPAPSNGQPMLASNPVPSSSNSLSPRIEPDGEFPPEADLNG